MKILNTLKTNLVKFTILGMAAFAVMGATATYKPMEVCAAEKTTSVVTYTETIPKAELDEIIKEAENKGALIRTSENSFILDQNCGTVVEGSYTDAGKVHLGEDTQSHYGIYNSFDYASQAEKFIKNMNMTEASVVKGTTIAKNSKKTIYFAVGNLPVVKLTYTSTVTENYRPDQGKGDMEYECPKCGAHMYEHLSAYAEHEFKCLNCGVCFD